MTRTVEQAKGLSRKSTAAKSRCRWACRAPPTTPTSPPTSYIKEGALGKVVLAQIDYSRNHKDDFWAYPIDADAKPGVNIDWKTLLGNTPKRAV